MKKFLLLMFLFFLFSCASNKTVYWCGDHACKNKKEKETYFKKTMTVEIKQINNKTKKKYSSHEKILQQMETDTKKKIKEEKELAKQLRSEEKMRIKKEKELAKQLKLKEKKKINKKNKLTKQINLKKDEEIHSAIFTELKQKIIEKNLFRPYPDINNIQN